MWKGTYEDTYEAFSFISSTMLNCSLVCAGNYCLLNTCFCHNYLKCSINDPSVCLIHCWQLFLEQHWLLIVSVAALTLHCLCYRANCLLSWLQCRLLIISVTVISAHTVCYIVKCSVWLFQCWLLIVSVMVLTAQSVYYSLIMLVAVLTALCVCYSANCSSCLL